MLDQKDLVAIRAIMKEEIAESEKKMEVMVDTRLAESEKKMEVMMDTRLAESEKKMEVMMDTRLAESEKKMEVMVDTRLAESENLILEEMERTRNILEKNIDKVQKNLDELNQYYRITKLENDNTALLLKMIDELTRRVEELEKKTA